MAPPSFNNWKTEEISLAVQWLGLGPFTAGFRVWSLVRDLKSRKLCVGAPLPRKKKKKERKKKKMKKLEKLCETMVFRPQVDLGSYTTLILERRETNGRWILSSYFLLEVTFSLQHLEILLSSGGRDHSFIRSRWLEFTVRVPERKELHNISAPDICSWMSLSLVEYKPIHLQEDIYPRVGREHLKGNKLNNSWS